MRAEIITNEIEDARWVRHLLIWVLGNTSEDDNKRHRGIVCRLVDRDQIMSLKDKREGNKLTKELLTSERRGIEDQVAALQEQLRLVDSHLAALDLKDQTIRKEEAEARARMTLLQKTLDGLLLEVDKYHLLAGGTDDED